MTFDKRWYLVDVCRGRVDYPALKAKVLSLAREWSATRVLVEDTASGVALAQELISQISGFIAVRPVGDKIARMAVASSKIGAGQVFRKPPPRAALLGVGRGR